MLCEAKMRKGEESCYEYNYLFHFFFLVFFVSSSDLSRRRHEGGSGWLNSSLCLLPSSFNSIFQQRIKPRIPPALLRLAIFVSP
jgi:hypothetical protein